MGQENSKTVSELSTNKPLFLLPELFLHKNLEGYDKWQAGLWVKLRWLEQSENERILVHGHFASTATVFIVFYFPLDLVTSLGVST